MGLEAGQHTETVRSKAAISGIGRADELEWPPAAVETGGDTQVVARAKGLLPKALSMAQGNCAAVGEPTALFAPAGGRDAVDPGEWFGQTVLGPSG
jgi:hypothetical protein